VGVDRRASRFGVGLVVEQRAQLCTLGRPLGAVVVEDVRDSAPARPPRELLLLVGRGDALVGL